MKKLLVILAVFGAAATVLSQQGTVRIHTNPQVPSLDTLDRLDLTMAWHTKVPVDGTRDGFYSLQLIPGKSFTLLLAQTFKRSVIAINAETGDTLWRTPVGLPYRSMQPVSASEQTVFVCRHETVFALDRDNGKQLLYTMDPDTNQPQYGFRMEAPATAGLAADAEFLFVCQGDRLVRFAVPNFRALAKLPPPVAEPGAKPQGSPQLVRTWHFTAPGNLGQTPILTREVVVVTTDDGMVSFINRSNPGADERPVFRGQFQTEGAVVAQVASHKAMVYAPCQDYFLYALDAAASRLSWRFAGQAPIVDAPKATDADIFVAVGKAGLYRLERANGNVKWASKDAAKFLATDQRFVYALDRLGKMLVLDYERGKALAAWDARDWVLPIPNDLTDRIYLASNDGQIVCLRQRDHFQPLRVKTFETVQPKGKQGKKKAEDKAPPGEDIVPKEKDDKDKAAPESGVRGQESGVRNQESGIRGQRSKSPAAREGGSAGSRWTAAGEWFLVRDAKPLHCDGLQTFDPWLLTPGS